MSFSWGVPIGLVRETADAMKPHTIEICSWDGSRVVSENKNGEEGCMDYWSEEKGALSSSAQFPLIMLNGLPLSTRTVCGDGNPDTARGDGNYGIRNSLQAHAT